uniref:Uncharacterized protein n=1 Tax=Hydatigena taeniaeformis TaxID=6205 RepID=A0A0R3X471_HYDTA
MFTRMMLERKNCVKEYKKVYLGGVPCRLHNDQPEVDDYRWCCNSTCVSIDI